MFLDFFTSMNRERAAPLREPMSTMRFRFSKKKKKENEKKKKGHGYTVKLYKSVSYTAKEKKKDK